VLKCLIWYCKVAGDDELKDCALWLLDVKWKQKRNTEKSMVALAELGVTKEELRARNLIMLPAPDPLPRWIEKMSQAVCRAPRAMAALVVLRNKAIKPLLAAAQELRPSRGAQNPRALGAHL
jgi:hypothetical protein